MAGMNVGSDALGLLWSPCAPMCWAFFVGRRWRVTVMWGSYGEVRGRRGAAAQRVVAGSVSRPGLALPESRGGRGSVMTFSQAASSPRLCVCVRNTRQHGTHDSLSGQLCILCVRGAEGGILGHNRIHGDDGGASIRSVKGGVKDTCPDSTVARLLLLLLLVHLTEHASHTGAKRVRLLWFVVVVVVGK